MRKGPRLRIEERRGKRMTLYTDQTGPLVQYENGTLHIEDLNPHQIIRWRMRRSEMLRLGIRCILAAIFK